MFKKKKNKRPDEISAFVYAADTQELIEKLRQIYSLYPDSFGGFAACFPKKKFNIDDYQGMYVMYCENKEELFKFYDYLHKVGRKWSRGSSYKDFRPTETFDGGATRYIYFNNGLQRATCDPLYTVLNFKDFDWSDSNMKETKFKVGDKVRVREDLKLFHKYGGYTYTKGMREMLDGKVATIAHVDHGCGCYHLVGDDFEYVWTDEMLELAEEKPFTKADLKPGMVVEVRDGARYLFVNEIFVSSGGYLQFISYNDDLTHATYDCLDVVKIFNTRGTEFGNILHDHHIDLIWKREEVKEMTVKEIEEKLGCKVKVIADKE